MLNSLIWGYLVTQIADLLRSPVLWVFVAIVVIGVILVVRWIRQSLIRFVIVAALSMVMPGVLIWCTQEDDVGSGPFEIVSEDSIEVCGVSGESLRYGRLGLRAVRLFGCDAPGDEDYRERYLNEVGRLCVGKQVTLLRLKGTSACIVLTEANTDLNRHLLCQGYVYASEDAPLSYRALAKTARESRLGIYQGAAEYWFPFGISWILSGLCLALSVLTGLKVKHE